MNKLFREPLFHFLLIGAALFFVASLVRESNPRDEDNQVIVSAGRIEQLANIFAKTWQRPPAPVELKGLIDDFVLEEIYYRQAVAMGIDRDDTVIRRRLRQKLEFLTDDMVTAVEPTEAELAAYLAANAGSFARDTVYTFEQVYINPQQPGLDLESHVAEQLAALRGGKAPGDAGLLPTTFDAASSRVVDNSFGAGFSAELDELPARMWQGPVESGVGLHLVRMHSRVAGGVPDLTDIRPIVEREWANEKRLEARQKIDRQFLESYDVLIEWPTGEAATRSENP